MHDHKHRKEITDEDFVLHQLELVTQTSFQDSELPAVFRNLVYAMRSLQHSQMVMIYNGLSKRKSKKMFEDALPLLKTDAGISLMRDIIKSGRLDDSVVNSWFSSLTFYKNPTRAMLTILSTFLDPVPAPAHSALLGISSLASTFCSAHPDCLQVAELRDLVTRLQHLLGPRCQTSTRAEQDTMVLVLKGIRNIGLMTGSADTLTECYKTKSNPMWVRAAAAEAVQTLACNYPDKDFGLLDSLVDIQEDSELRIGVYRALMMCPTELVVEAVKTLLTREEVNQGKLSNMSASMLTIHFQLVRLCGLT